jgi:quercetin dioxygenase-like cupin family protein
MMTQDPLRMPHPGEPVPFEIPGATGDFRIQILNEDGAKGVVTSIVHLPAGGRIPAHSHQAGAEMHYVLEGDLIEGGETLPVGAFMTHAAGVVHGPHESRGGAKVLTVQSWQSEGGEFDFLPVEGGEGASDTGGPDRSGPGGGAAPAGSTPASAGPDATLNPETQEGQRRGDTEPKGYG